MIKQISFAIVAAFIFSSCTQSSQDKTTNNIVTDTTKVVSEPQDECTALLKKAQQADNVLLNATSFNKTDAEIAINAFYKFVSVCQKDSMTPIYLLKGGQVAQSIGDYNKAKDFFYLCINNFPDFKNRGAAMFLLAQLYDTPTMLNKEEEAKKLYEQIIKEYPQTNFANDAKACLKNLGKSDEQLIQEFLKNNKNS